MSILDNPGEWRDLDGSSMWKLVESFAGQFRDAAKSAAGLRLPAPGRIDNVVVAGMGGSAIGGDVVHSAFSRELRVPFLVSREYTLPAFASEGTVVFACSYSGNTEETLATLEDARRCKASIFCITSGGRLAALGRAEGYPVIDLPAGMPPRAALAYSSVLLLGALRSLNLVPDTGPALNETAALLEVLNGRYGTGVPEEKNPAKQVARSLAGRIVAVYGSAGLLDAAAARWRGQIEENAKNLAFHHLLPEMNHNEIVGWCKPEDELRRLGVILLRDRGEHPQVRRRFEATADALRGRADIVHAVWSEGESLLARTFSVICLGDFVSLYLAYLNKVDPTPVEAIESLKQKLAAIN